MKRCSRCKIEKELDEFNKSKSTKDGLQNMCKLCQKQYQKEYQKQYYQLNREKKKQYFQRNKEKRNQYTNQYYHRNPEKNKARNMLNNAVKSGKVHKPVFCSSCEGDKHLEAHHTDYSKPLEVLWLCRSCHRELHNKIRDKEYTT